MRVRLLDDLNLCHNDCAIKFFSGEGHLVTRLYFAQHSGIFDAGDAISVFVSFMGIGAPA